MDDQRKLAFEFAKDTTKQLITLSTAIVGLSVTFAKDIFKSSSQVDETLLVSAWITYLVSICFGVLTLMALTGCLDPLSEDSSDNSKLTVNSNSIRVMSMLQILTYVMGLILTVKFGIESVS